MSSMLYAKLWQPGAEAVARCRRSLAYLPWGRMPIHDAPAADCVCGIYGARAPQFARSLLTAPAGGTVAYRVLGQVALCGRVVEAELGWRSAFGYPSNLYVPTRSQGARLGWRRRRLSPTEVASALQVYDVPVSITDFSASKREIVKQTP
ncbi:MAG: hypothetical protein ACR2OD_13310 [Gaiellaceae bacterium]